MVRELHKQIDNRTFVALLIGSMMGREKWQVQASVGSAHNYIRGVYHSISYKKGREIYDYLNTKKKVIEFIRTNPEFENK